MLHRLFDTYFDVKALIKIDVLSVCSIKSSKIFPLIWKTLLDTFFLFKSTRKPIKKVVDLLMKFSDSALHNILLVDIKRLTLHVRVLYIRSAVCLACFMYG